MPEVLNRLQVALAEDLRHGRRVAIKVLHPELPPSRLAILVSGLGGSGASSLQRHIAFLPDGQGVVYSVITHDGTFQLIRHALDAESGTAIQGAEPSRKTNVGSQSPALASLASAGPYTSLRASVWLRSIISTG